MLCKKKVAGLEDELSRYQTPENSSKSSVPPSKDENRPVKTKSLSKSSARKSGGQQGRKGHTLEISGTPDLIKKHIPQYCNCCGNNLEDIQAHLHKKRQLIGLPVIKTIREAHQSYRKVCQCGHINEGQFPEHLKSPVRYGNNIAALVGCFHARQYLLYERMSELFSTCFGLNISQGRVDTLIDRLASKSEGIYKRIKKNFLHFAAGLSNTVNHY